MTADYQALIDRIDAEGPSRELDAEITIAFRAVPIPPAKWVADNFPVWRVRSDGKVEAVHADGSGGPHWTPTRFTESVDAVLSLIEAELPGCFWLVGRGKTTPDEPEYGARLLRGEITDGTVDLLGEAEDDRSPALALLKALLLAKMAEER